MEEEYIRIGLYGTCGNSKYRFPFLEKYSILGIPSYNPQVEVGKWDPSMAEEEARHMANDAIILFPITDEEYSLGSLSETGYSILNAIRIDNMRNFVVMISPTLKEELKGDPRYEESIRQRALVKQHLLKLRMDNLYVVDTLEEMLEVSLTLYKIVKLRSSISHFNPHRM